jgi:hypothetical protein
MTLGSAKVLILVVGMDTTHDDFMTHSPTERIERLEQLAALLSRMAAWEREHPGSVDDGTVESFARTILGSVIESPCGYAAERGITGCGSDRSR